MIIVPEVKGRLLLQAIRALLLRTMIGMAAYACVRHGLLIRVVGRGWTDAATTRPRAYELVRHMLSVASAVGDASSDFHDAAMLRKCCAHCGRGRGGNLQILHGQLVEIVEN